eukprot:SM000031S11638  [mRNA]  locus=s31:790868:791237:+ [translate_table: standard]
MAARVERVSEWQTRTLPFDQLGPVGEPLAPRAGPARGARGCSEAAPGGALRDSANVDGTAAASSAPRPPRQHADGRGQMRNSL